MTSSTSSLFEACVEQLSQLISSDRLAIYENEVPEILWQDELGRLRIWAKEAQLPSLEVRLHDAFHIREQVICILLRLQRALSDMLNALDDTPEEAMSDADTDDDDVDGTEMQMIYHSVRDTINCLFNITMVILQPAYHPLVSAKVGGLSRSDLVQGASPEESAPVERSAAAEGFTTVEHAPVDHEDPEEAATATPREQIARGIGGDATEAALPARVPAAAGAELARRRKRQSLDESKSSSGGIRRSDSLVDRWNKSLEEAKRQSLTASVTDYPTENGRRYHKYHEGLYIYPNDEQELDRLDMQHHMVKLVNDGRLFFAPIHSPKRILDIGTGSGIWPIEMASIFPEAEIIGTDLSPVQPTEVPNNVHFLVDDATEEDWLWDADHFDLIHTGHMIGSFPSFKDVLRKAFKHLKPSGYMECHEFDPKLKCDDGTMPPENPDGFCEYALHDWVDLNVRSSQITDPPRQFRIAHRIAHWMKEVGFVDVQERISKVPTNPWPEDPHMRTIGTWNETNWLEALSGWSYKPLLALGWSKPEIECFLVDVRKSIQNRDVHSYMDFYVVTGRKPDPGEQYSMRR